MTTKFDDSGSNYYLTIRGTKEELLAIAKKVETDDRPDCYGKWVCECGHYSFDYSTKKPWKFCPKCGKEA